MKNKHFLFLAIPALMLASCGNGNEITDSSVIAAKASAITSKVEDLKNYKFVVNTDSASYDDEAKKNVATKIAYVLERNEDDEVRCHSESTIDGKKTTSDFYLVNDATYQQVLYMDDFADGEHDIQVYGYEGNETTFAFAAFSIFIPAAMLANYADASSVLEAMEADEDNKYDVKYYSKGDGDLTVVANVTPKEAPKADGEEELVSSKIELHYVNDVFKEAKIEGKSNKGNVSKANCALTVKDKFDITLPSGWEALINKNVTEE